MRPFVLIIILASCLLASCAKNNSNALSQEIAKVEIHYIRWQLDTFRPFSCNDLSDADSIILTERKIIDTIVELLIFDKLDKLPDCKGIDARICCHFLSAKGAVINELVLDNSSVMKFKGECFALPKELIVVISRVMPQNYFGLVLPE